MVGRGAPAGSPISPLSNVDSPRHHLFAARGPDSGIRAPESRVHPISNTYAKRNPEQLRGFRGAYLDSRVSLESLEQSKPYADLLFQFDHQTPWHVSGIPLTPKSKDFLSNELMIWGTPQFNEFLWNPNGIHRNPLDSIGFQWIP